MLRNMSAKIADDEASTVSSRSTISGENSANTYRSDNPKFTRGEKCIFIHIVATFSILILLLLIYFVHLCVVNHSERSALQIYRRKGVDDDEISNMPVGLLYLNLTQQKIICNSLLLKPKWSLVPGHCAAIRSDPDMSGYYQKWRIKYKCNSPIGFTVTHIKRSIPHIRFNREDFSNNIGLIEHETPVGTYKYIFPAVFTANHPSMNNYNDVVSIVGWEHYSTYDDEKIESLGNFNARLEPLDKCFKFLAPVVDLRTYEYCAVLLDQRGQVTVDHGAILVVEEKIVGIFSWGEKSGKGMPLIIVNILHYKDWIENVIS